MNSFDQRKHEVLSKIDKSSKGSWDKPILNLCEKLNSMKNYYTTSSCSGRVLLMRNQEKKAEGLFNWVSHGEVSFDELFFQVSSLSLGDEVKFKQDPPILHVACRTLKDAKILYDKAKLVGWKRSGLISFGKRIVLELNSTEKLEFPVIVRGKKIVSEEFLRGVSDNSNFNLKRGWGKIESLVDSIDSLS